MNERGLPNAPAGREIAREHGGERDEGQAEGEDAQAHYRPGVAYPQKTDGLGKEVEYHAGRRAEDQAVGRAAAHRPADPAAAPETDLLRHEPGDCEAYAADGEGRGQQLHAHDELVEPYARRAYAPGQPGLEDHTYAAHEQRSPGQQRRIHD